MLKSMLMSLAVAAGASLCVAAPAQAPQTGSKAQVASPAPSKQTTFKIGFVDLDVVIDRSKAVRQIISEVDGELAVDARFIEDRNRELRRLKLSLEQQSAALSDEERRVRQDKVLDLMNEIDEMEYRFQRTARQKQRRTIEPLLEQVMLMVAEVGEREGYDLIVRGELVLYGRQTVDLTPSVIAEMDKRVDELRATIFPKAAADKDEDEKAQPEPLPLIP